MADEPLEPIDDFPEIEGLPEFYADGYSFSANPYTVNLTFTIGIGVNETRNEVIVRMSPGHAKMMAILFKRNVKTMEDQFGSEIPIPQALLERHSIDLSTDW